MMTLVTLLEGIIPGELFAAIVLILIGSLSLRQGWVAYTEPIPRFVINYRGWTCPPLAMFHGGVAMLLMSVPAFKLPPPQDRSRSNRADMAFCGLTSLLGLFFWFPRFLLPRWYRRAVKAGVPRNDPNAMGAFKALPVEQQREAAQRGKQR